VITVVWAARVVLLAPLVLVLSHVAATPARACQQPPAPADVAPPDPEAGPRDPEAGSAVPAPVLLGGEPIIWVLAGAGPYTPQFRAERISRRLREIVRDRQLQTATVTVTERDGSSELSVGGRLLLVVTSQDARSLGAARSTLAQHYARVLDEAIHAERLRYAPATLIRSSLYGVVATLGMIAAVWLVRRLTRAIHSALRRRAAQGASLRVLQLELLSADRLGRTIQRTIDALRLLLILVALELYVTFVLGLFPWTRAVSFTLLDYMVAPLRTIAAAFVDYLPKLVFILVIVAFVNVAFRLVGLFFRQIQQGRITFTKFPAEWAEPTSRIVKALLIAFGVVVAFPYLPASASPAFTGVSVFMGVLISLSSSSALSNIIAGFVLTYTGAFRLGDRVQVGDTFGDIAETALLATHVRTIKNEDVTIPNSIVLSSSVINYSRAANAEGLILHTSVTIGYDTPWRRIHELLVDAALQTPGIRHEPAPFVWQTALNDFYVTYEVNAYTSVPRDMVAIYAELHARIQEVFAAACVEIMSPHYTSLRDGSAVTIPQAFRPSA
jgi:small-conductance mechanosensitive channel